MTRKHLPGILAMAAIVVASNILVQFLFGNWLTWGAFTYPLAFLVTDVMNRVYGVQAARKVVLAGFIVGIVCSLIGTRIVGEFGPLVTLR
ncbi:MAG TPA: VUT family protein, partial [Chromatiaceae bacterium]|nr:VUT family protein [Chromatiaceae bacterium]